MAEMDTSSGGGHKKGPGVKEREEALYASRPYSHGGPGFSPDYVLHFHDYHERTYCYEAFPAERHGKT